MTRKLVLAHVGLYIALGCAGSAYAQSTNKPAATNNQCWGRVASGLAQYDSPYFDPATMNGGPMGMHTRSATAAANNGGFATNPFFTIPQPRDGVGNGSRNPASHNTAPGDGGNGQHAVNNGELRATFLDPVTGTPIPDGSGQPIECSLLDPNISPPHIP